MSALTFWVLFDHPADFPDHFVLRTHTADEVGRITYGTPHLCASLEQARALVPPGLYRLDRFPEDVPSLVETWF